MLAILIVFYYLCWRIIKSQDSRTCLVWRVQGLGAVLVANINSVLPGYQAVFHALYLWTYSILPQIPWGMFIIIILHMRWCFTSSFYIIFTNEPSLYLRQVKPLTKGHTEWSVWSQSPWSSTTTLEDRRGSCKAVILSASVTVNFTAAQTCSI